MIVTTEPLPRPLSFVYHLMRPLIYLFLYTCMVTYGGAHNTTYMWWSEYSFQELVHYFHLVVPGHQTWR